MDGMSTQQPTSMNVITVHYYLIRCYLKGATDVAFRYGRDQIGIACIWSS